MNLTETCGHDMGIIVSDEHGTLRCDRCQTIMVIVPQEWLEQLLCAHRDLLVIEEMRANG